MPASTPASSSTRVTRTMGASSDSKLVPNARPRPTRASTNQSKLRNTFIAPISSDHNSHEDTGTPLSDEQPRQLLSQRTNTHDVTSSSPARPRRHNPVAKVLSPFGESHNRRPALRRRTSPEKSRKRRSLDKPAIPDTPAPVSRQPTYRTKPRASAPSRIPVRSIASVTNATHTPERSRQDVEGFIKSGEDSLKKLSLAELMSPGKKALRSPTFSPPDNSPSSGRQFKMMDAPFHSRGSSDLLELFFDTSPEQTKIQRFPLQFRSEPQPSTSRTFQRQVSHAHVLFGGPAISSPPGETPPESSQPTQCDDDDDFFKAPSPAKGPVVEEPEIVRKFKPRDSGIVVSDESEIGSPPAKKIPRLLQLATKETAPVKDQETCTPTTRAARRAVRWPADIPLGDEHGSNQKALKILFQTLAGTQEKDKASGPRTPVKKSNATRMFSSVPRPRPMLAPTLAAKGASARNRS